MQILELEAHKGNPEATSELHKEILTLRNRAETLCQEVARKDKEIEMLKKQLDDNGYVQIASQKVEDKLKVR